MTEGNSMPRISEDSEEKQQEKERFQKIKVKREDRWAYLKSAQEAGFSSKEALFLAKNVHDQIRELRAAIADLDARIIGLAEKTGALAR